ncbi:uncharacterized protein LOC116744087 [Phocoena sinus]|uniref:uncharacterized protein LOC116744087 n=1 Tax=Phocoena sinus TaxID=42100 RepID=UPI0013C437BB|nr:uncharacterized protein LOC116744087 [Phocoena sinus]
MTPLPCLPASIPFPHPRNAEIWATALAGPTQTGFLCPHPLKADVFKRAHFARRLQAFEELMHATCSEPGLTQSKSSKGLLVPGIGKTRCWELRAKGSERPWKTCLEDVGVTLREQRPPPQTAPEARLAPWHRSKGRTDTGTACWTGRHACTGQAPSGTPGQRRSHADALQATCRPSDPGRAQTASDCVSTQRTS